jgi:hypothetical protein
MSLSFSSRLRRWRVPGVMLVVLAVALATVSFVIGRKIEGQPQADSLPGIPIQQLLTSSMRQQPVPGWKLTVAQLGLPPGTVVRPVGNVGDRGLFLGITDEGWWMMGIDVGTGQRLFGPVRLGPADNASDFNCFVNGPNMALCLRQHADPDAPARAWVVDTEGGKLIFDGTTDMRIAPSSNHPQLQQVGDYVVAEVSGEGIHGVGTHAELTWLVPGDGLLSSQFNQWSRDNSPSNLAVQHSAGSVDVVFSVVDGAVLKPSVPQDQKLGRAIVYPGGFGYEYTTGDQLDRVAFFDTFGKELSRPELVGTLRIGSLDVPMVETESNDVVVTLDGRQLLELPKSVLMPYARLIGTKLFVTTDEEHGSWRQFDLRTGDAGNTCQGDTLGYQYIASDGEVAVALTADTPAQGVDLSSCDALWSVQESAPNEAQEVWKVDTTLVQRTDDTLFSLVAPH